MFSKSFVTLTSLCAIVLAAPAKPVTYLDTYDTIKSPVIVTQFNAVPVGTYNGLSYTNWLVGHDGITGNNGGLIEPSHPQVAVGYLNAAPSLISSNYSGSSVRSFDLNYFYFGCLGNTFNAELSLPVGCDIALQGFDVNGRPVGEQTFSFAPAQNPEESPMYAAVLPPSYKNLREVSFAVSTSTTTQLLTDILIDNLSHTNYAH